MRSGSGSRLTSAVVGSAVATPVSHAVIRTCIGCRQRADSAELLRVVVDSAPPSGPALSAPRAVPDPRRSARGRGAWLHPVPRCAELAERRRAFGRALRVETMLDLTAVREYVEAVSGAASR